MIKTDKIYILFWVELNHCYFEKNMIIFKIILIISETKEKIIYALNIIKTKGMKSYE